MIIKVKPAIYQSDSVPWGWVRLAELAEIIGQTPKETWENFFGLTKDIQYDVLAWSLDLEEIVQDGTEPEDFSSAFVPAGWAMDVLAARQLGAVRVKVVRHEHLTDRDTCPAGALTCYFCGNEFKSAVGIRADGILVETKGA